MIRSIHTAASANMTIQTIPRSAGALRARPGGAITTTIASVLPPGRRAPAVPGPNYKHAVVHGSSRLNWLAPNLSPSARADPRNQPPCGRAVRYYDVDAFDADSGLNAVCDGASDSLLKGLFAAE